ncbi:MAG TPA: PilT/PilU family type 4a pilus ATPase [Armatimonadota bacterium]|nr:PilT/PilU family type 4a pilus ATPase [Armatimonadota bacterium]
MIPTSVSTNQQTAKILERQNILPSNILDGLINRARTLQEWIGQVAVEDGLLSYEELALAISKELRVPLISLKTFTPDYQAFEMISKDICLEYDIFPTSYNGSVITVAFANPLDETVVDILSNIISDKISKVVAPRGEIRQAIEEWYSNQRDVEEEFTPIAEAIPPKETSDIDLVAQIFADLPKKTTTNTINIKPQVQEKAPEKIDPHDITIDQLLLVMLEHRASDLHLAVGSPPMMRVDGDLIPMSFPKLVPSSVQTMIYAILTDVQITQFERHWELDFAYSIPKVSRFRVNVHRQRGSVGAVLRTIPEDMPTLDALHMPTIVREMTERPRGLVLVTGPTGSGKSTTLAAMIDEINRTRRTHIVTIEDPIEFLHKNKMSVVTQREVGADTESFSIALRHVLRQDPDVILIGEMRDLETIAAAVTAAETGHLVLATLHTTSAAQTIERIIDVFPPHQQEQIRSQLSNTLEGILTQTLLPNIDGHGRSCAQEILVCTPAIRNLIREGKVHQMASVLQASAKYGMQTLDTALKQLVLTRKVSLEQAILKASDPEDFKALLAMQ